MPESDAHDNETALFSNSFVFKVTAFIGLLAAVATALTFAGKFYGNRLALDGHTATRDIIHIAIGQDVLDLPANMIRFENQRHDGGAKVINLYLSWPEMDGYTTAGAARFSDPHVSRDLIFLELSQSVMSRDMSGRFEPIYSKLIEGMPAQGPAGLTLHHLSQRSGFGAEMLVTGKTRSRTIYVARCIFPADPTAATAADCQRDIHVGRDLSLLYRFSTRNLNHWEAIDDAVRAFAVAHIQDGVQ